MSYKKILITVNAETGVIVDSSREAVRDAYLPQLYYGEIVIVCVSFVDSLGVAYPLNDTDLFELSIDKDFVHTITGGGDDPLMAYSGNDMVDISGDWTSISRIGGKISIRVDCMTEGFLQKIASSENISAYIEAKRYIAGSAYPSELLRNKIYAKNVVKTTEGTPASADPEYYNAVQTDALLSAKADKAGTSDIEITDHAKGLIFRCTDGSRVRMTIGYVTDDSGNKIFNPVFTIVS